MPPEVKKPKDRRKVRILLVEDDPDFGDSLDLRLSKRGYEVSRATTAEKALGLLDQDSFEMVISDIKLPNMDGIVFLEKVREQHPGLPVIMLTGHANLDTAKEAVRLRAFDYLLKPLDDINDLVGPIEKAVEAERKQVEERIQSEKLTAIGQLAAGVAHELNSPLAGLLSLIRSFLQKTDKSDPNHELFGVMKEATEHAAKIVADLTAFSRQSKREFQPVDFHEIIDRTLSFSAHLLEREGILIQKEYAENLPPVPGHPSQLQQVVLNMMTNARDSMDGLSKAEKKFIIATGLSPNREGIEVSFSDTGCGIDPKILRHIFDPFFTTKPQGKGVGLGLSVTHGIIETHRGKIEVESQIGKGTRFKITLPLSKGKEEKDA